MTIEDLYTTLCVDGVLVLEGRCELLESIRTRLIKKKYREQKKQGEFAEKELQLRFNWLEVEDNADDIQKLEITLTARGEDLGDVTIC